MLASTIVFIHLIIITFLVTNLDNLVVLLLSLKKVNSNKTAIISGYIISVFFVILITLLLSISSTKLISDQDVDYLGIIPLCLGVYKILLKCFSKGSKLPVNPSIKKNLRGRYLSNIAIQFSCSADNVLLFLPLVLHHRSHMSYIIFATALTTLSVIFSLLAIFCASHLNLLRFQRINGIFFPYFLIALGLYILFF